MTQIVLRLPTGGTRRYVAGTRVNVGENCPQFPAGGPGTVSTLVNRMDVVVRMDCTGRVIEPISADSVFLMPLD